MPDDGKRSLFSGASDEPGPTKDGKQALFSDGTGPIKIDCARCGATSHISIFDALGRLVRFSWWVPGRTYSHRLTCPSCDQRSWTRIRIL